MKGEIPKTLFAMASVQPESARLANSVLIIIDAQREYTDGALPLAGIDEAVNEITRLLVRARKAGAPVIHIVHKGKGTLFNPDGPYFEIVAPLQPLADEAIIEKTRVSAFVDTELEAAIQRTGRKNLIIVGFMTHHCVSSTTRAARDLGYMPTIVASTTATRDLPDNHGRVVKASELQTAILAELADGIASVVQNERDIQE